MKKIWIPIVAYISTVSLVISGALPSFRVFQGKFLLAQPYALTVFVLTFVGTYLMMLYREKRKLPV